MSALSKAGRLIDVWYSRIVHTVGLTGPFFASGWGDLGVIDFQHDRQTLAQWPPSHFDTKIDWKLLDSKTYQGTPYEVLEAEFQTPCIGRTYDALPSESRIARVRMLLPKLPSSTPTHCVVHLAGTGDHGYSRRLSLGLPLLKHGIGCMALESPYYGLRRPAGQRGSKLQHVSDLLTLGRATIEESLLLLHWAKLQGMDRLGTSGFSMGGVHASMVASLYPGDVACAPLLAPRSAAIAYCRGALRSATAWQQLTARADKHQRDLLDAVQQAVQAMSVIQQGVLLQPLQQHTGNATGDWQDGQTDSQIEAQQAAVREASDRLTDALGEAIHAATGMRDAGAMVSALAVQQMQQEGFETQTEHAQLNQQQPNQQQPNQQQGKHNKSATLSTAHHQQPDFNRQQQQQQQQQRFEQQDHERVELREGSQAASAGNGFVGSAAGNAEGNAEGNAVGNGQALHAGVVFEPRVARLQTQGVVGAAEVEQAVRAAAESSAGVDEDALREEQEATLAQDDAAGEPEAQYWLEQVLEAYTDVTRYPRPRRTDAAVLVGATDDAYVDRASIAQHAAYWPRAELRWVAGGHVSAFLLCKKQFRQAITDSITRL